MAKEVPLNDLRGKGELDNEVEGIIPSWVWAKPKVLILHLHYKNYTLFIKCRKCRKCRIFIYKSTNFVGFTCFEAPPRACGGADTEV